MPSTQPAYDSHPLGHSAPRLKRFGNLVIDPSEVAAIAEHCTSTGRCTVLLLSGHRLEAQLDDGLLLADNIAGASE